MMITWNQILEFTSQGNPTPPRRVELSDDEWRDKLSNDVFRVTRLHGTERPFSGQFCESHQPGRYLCACCDNPLFDSGEKFDSGTGWPSFDQPVSPNAIQYRQDRSLNMQRVEVLCNVCDAHLGHVFPDGPKPSGLRYCINSTALTQN